MASEADHISLANKNHKALMLLLGEHQHYPEWVAAIAFYKAVHVVEAVFHHRWNHDSSNHGDRRERLKRMMPKNYFQDFET